jgi:hypothetical protein
LYVRDPGLLVEEVEEKIHNGETFFRHLLSAFIRQTLEKCLFDHREWGFWRKSMASQESVLAKLCINDE